MARRLSPPIHGLIDATIELLFVLSGNRQRRGVVGECEAWKRRSHGHVLFPLLPEAARQLTMTVSRSLHLPMSILVSEYWTLHNLDCLFEYLAPIYGDGLVGGEALSPKSRRTSVFHGHHPSRPCSDQRGPVTTSFARRRLCVSRRRASRVLGDARLQGASRMRKLDAMRLRRGPQWQTQSYQAGRARSSVCATNPSGQAAHHSGPPCCCDQH